MLQSDTVSQFETQSEDRRAAELLRKVRKIEIRTRGLSRQLFAGEYHSAFKGRGMAFSEVREYQAGDDVRTIDWKVTARLNHPYIKIFEEERELTVMLAIDVSPSGDFGSNKMLKAELITELAAVLAFSVIRNNDKVGCLFFTDRIEKFIPPQKGKSHVLRIIRELVDFEPQGRGTDVGTALRYLTQMLKKRSTVFLLTDFLDFQDFSTPLKIASRKHDLVALRVIDNRERELPAIGLLRLMDPETGREIWVDSNDKAVRNTWKAWWLGHEARLQDLFRKSGVDVAELHTDRSYIQPLMNVFKQRS